MKQLFKDEALNTSFNELGYIVLKNVVQTDFDDTYKFFNQLDAKVDGTFYASLWSRDRNYRNIVDTKIKSLLSPICEQFLQYFEPFFGDALVKKPSLHHHFEWHQDWTFVDEDITSSIYIWCPLQDVTKQNGCLMVLPYSHKFLPSIRGSNISPTFSSKDVSPIASKYAQYISIKKGDVVIFNQALFHASPPNRTFKNRLAIGLLCLPSDNNTFHYHYNIETQKTEKYLIDYEYIMSFSSDQDFIKNLYASKISTPSNCQFLENITPKTIDKQAMLAAYKST